MTLEEQLFEAISEGNIEKVRYLLAQGANPNVKHYSCTPIFYAAYFPFSKGWSLNKNIIELLLKYGAYIDTRNNFHNTPLLEFIENLGHYNYRRDSNNTRVEIIRLLLEHGANVNITGRSNSTPIELFLSYFYKYRDLQGSFFYFLAYGATLNDDDRSIINSEPHLQNCLAAFKEIKTTLHLGKLIEVNKSRNKKESAEAIAEYINDEAMGQELISKFKIIKEEYGSDEQLSFIPEYLLSMMKNMAQDYKKVTFSSKIAGEFLSKLLHIKGGSDVGGSLGQYLNAEDITNLSKVNKGMNLVFKPLNKLMTELKEIYQSPNTSLAEAQPETASSQSQSAA